MDIGRERAGTASVGVCGNRIKFGVMAGEDAILSGSSGGGGVEIVVESSVLASGMVGGRLLKKEKEDEFSRL